jgi:hypothetical protein
LVHSDLHKPLIVAEEFAAMADFQHHRWRVSAGAKREAQRLRDLRFA